MLFVATLVFAAVFVLTVALGKNSPEDKVYSRLKEMVAQGKNPNIRKAELAQPLRTRVVQPLIRTMSLKLAAGLPKERLQQLNHRLEKAGMGLKFQGGEWLALKWVMSLVSGVLFLLVSGLLQDYLIKSVILSVLVSGMVALFFDWRLISRINLRKKQIMKELPEVLDLITISVEAGLGFDGAMGKVAEKGNGNLAEEFRLVLKEMEIGMPRKEALKGMSLRLDVEPLKVLVNALLQADQLGLGMARVLRNQGHQVRQDRKYAAQEAAMKAPVKMLFPLIFLIFPAIFIVLLGPAALQIVALFSGGGFP